MRSARTGGPRSRFVLFSRHTSWLLIRATTRPRIMRSIRIGAVTSGHGARVRRNDSSAPGGASCSSLSTTVPATSVTRVRSSRPPRDPLPVLADRRRSGGAAAHDTSRDLRDDRAASPARRHPHSPPRPVSRGRPATLAGPEARAIAGGVTAMSVTLRPYRSGGWEVDITIRLPDGTQYRERKRASRFSKSAAQRWAEDRERYLLQHGPPADTQGGAHTGSVRAEIRRRSRAGEPSQAERD